MFYLQNSFSANYDMTYYSLSLFDLSHAKNINSINIFKRALEYCQSQNVMPFVDIKQTLERKEKMQNSVHFDRYLI